MLPLGTKSTAIIILHKNPETNEATHTTEMGRGGVGGNQNFNLKRDYANSTLNNLRKILADMTCATFSYFPSLCIKKLL